MLPRQTAEEESRHAFLIDLKSRLIGPLADGNRLAWERRARPAFADRRGRDPADRHEAGAAMRPEPYYQLWSALGRIQQELYVDSTAACVARQRDALTARYRELTDPPRHGTLRLDPDLAIPRYISEVDIHCVPGGYFAEQGADDVAVGARYDIGSFIFGRGLRGPLNDTRGLTGVKAVRERFADLEPRRILDMGCAAGMNTLPYADAWPGAEVHAVDVSAPALRYAHARAEALGRAVRFSQQDAERTDFPDGHFDLVVSHILFHESSAKGVAGFLREGARLLRPGGAMLHLDVPRRLTATTPYDQFIADWDTLSNNEPFWGRFLFDLDVVALAEAAGLADVSESLAPTPSGKASYWALAARRPT